MTVFPHRGLSPLQFTPMSGAHKITGANAGGPPWLPVRRRWAGCIAPALGMNSKTVLTRAGPSQEPAHRQLLRIHQSFRPRLFAPVLMILLLPFVLRAQFTIVTNNGTITITGYTGPGGDVVIPAV